MTAFDPTKPVQTRDGRKAGIYRVLDKGEWRIHGWVENKRGELLATNRNEFGRLCTTQIDGDDLINIPAPPRRWLVHVLKNGEVEHCDTQRCYSRIEVIELTPAVREALKAKGLLP